MAIRRTVIQPAPVRLGALRLTSPRYNRATDTETGVVAYSQQRTTIAPGMLVAVESSSRQSRVHYVDADGAGRSDYTTREGGVFVIRAVHGNVLQVTQVLRDPLGCFVRGTDTFEEPLVTLERFRDSSGLTQRWNYGNCGSVPAGTPLDGREWTRAVSARVVRGLDTTPAFVSRRRVTAVLNSSKLPGDLFKHAWTLCKTAHSEAFQARMLAWTAGHVDRYAQNYPLTPTTYLNRVRVTREQGALAAKSIQCLAKAVRQENAATIQQAFKQATNAIGAGHRVVPNVNEVYGSFNQGSIVLKAVKRLTGVELKTDSRGGVYVGAGVQLVICITPECLPVFDTFAPGGAAVLGAVNVTFADGSAHPCVGGLSRYNWNDGTTRLWREPELIGRYHSNKAMVGFVDPIVPHPVGREGWPTIGFELEVQAVGGDRNAQASKIRALVDQKLGPVQGRKYLGFEEDGSIGATGFEMVSGWTDLATHATVMNHVLLKDDGTPRWRGVLKSHDAGGACCGLHVHITKPRTLVHGAKIAHFMSSDMFEPMVKAVCRRYNVSFARKSGSPHLDDPKKMAVEYVKSSGYRRMTATANMGLNASRYEHVNFQNPKTVEFRLPRGTLVYRSFMAALELTLAVWRYAKETPQERFTQESFLGFISEPHQSKETGNLRGMLHDKGFTVRVPNPKKGITRATLEEDGSVKAVVV